MTTDGDAPADDGTTDDWAPLPSDDVCARPGESCELRKRPLPAPPSPMPPAAPPAPPPPPAPPDPAVEAALAALKQKLAATAPATSLVAAVQHREQRAERRRKAAASECAATLVKVSEVVAPAPDAAPDGATAPPPVGAKTAAATETDPREQEKWFRALPEAERERLRARWWLVKHRHDDQGAVLRKRLERALGYGALCFFALSLLQSMLLGGFACVPIFTAAGALAAGIAEMCKGGRFVYAGMGAAAFVAVMGAGVIAQPLSLGTLMIAAYGMGVIGMDGEMRRSGGFREK